MKKIFTTLVLFFGVSSAFAQADRVHVKYDDDGFKLVVNDNDFFINGMNWDYFPIGTNYAYSLWDQPDEVITAALDNEMSLLKELGINTIRQYASVPPKWITYIYKKYGIYTMLNHPFGRYGLMIDEKWIAHTNYSDKKVQIVLLAQIKELAETYKDTPGLLMYLLGNENNYGLFWEGAETEDIPQENHNSTETISSLYQLFNAATLVIKEIDHQHPVAICNGDLQYLGIIAKECTDINILGVNIYRGVSFDNAFQRVKDELNKPILFTEFGADAYNMVEQKEDQLSQAYYIVGNWKEIYENAAGLGKADNSIGGFTFQFSDGWWKFDQTKNLDIHDTHASWSNGGYKKDFRPHQNNMNEEWFGVCAKGVSNEKWLYPLYPRAAYYALKEIHELNPLKEDASLKEIDKHFKTICLKSLVRKAKKRGF